MENCSDVEADLIADVQNLRQEANVLLESGHSALATLFFAEARRITLVLIGLRGVMSRKETKIMDPIRPRIHMADYYYDMAKDHRRWAREIKDINPKKADWYCEVADALDNLACEVEGKYIEV